MSLLGMADIKIQLRELYSPILQRSAPKLLSLVMEGYTLPLVGVANAWCEWSRKSQLS